MKLQEIQESSWYKERPEIIQKAIDATPPGMYKFKDSGHQCQLSSYEEHGDDDDVTVTVLKTGVGASIPALNHYRVFGVKPTDLEPWK